MRSRYLNIAAVGLLLASSVVQAHDWGGGWDQQHHWYRLRAACEDGYRQACVRLGMEIAERREAWRQSSPEPYEGWRYHHGRGWQQE